MRWLAGLFYDGHTGLFYNGHTQQWYSFDAASQQYSVAVAAAPAAKAAAKKESAVSAVTMGSKKQHSAAMDLWNQRKQVCIGSLGHARLARV
jgi:hypothetical protein